MLIASEDRTALRFSTGDVPPDSRLADYCAVFRDQTVGFDIGALDDAFSCEVAYRALPGLGINRIAGSPVKVGWQNKTGNEEMVGVALFQAGKGLLSHCGREATVGAGCAVVLSSADQLSMVRTRARYAFLSMPRRMLAPLIADVDAAIMSLIPADTDALRHLANYVELLTSDTTVMGPELGRIATIHVHDLVALAVGATRDAAEIANGRGLRAARLRAIRADIMSNLGSGEVRAAHLAARHGVSPRYIHKLFETEGTTLSRFVLGQRLARVHRLLADPCHAGSTISAIAYCVGFGDLSTFNREFRRAYGATPSDVRAAGTGGRR